MGNAVATSKRKTHNHEYIYSIVTTLDVTVEYQTLVNRDITILSKTEGGSEKESMYWKASISKVKERTLRIE